MVSARGRRQQEVEYARKRGLSWPESVRAGPSGPLTSLRYKLPRLATKDAPVRARMCEARGAVPTLRLSPRSAAFSSGAKGFRDGSLTAQRIDSGARLGFQGAFADGHCSARWLLSRPRPLPPTGPNHVWAYDFVFDTLGDGPADQMPDRSSTSWTQARRWPSTWRAASAPARVIDVLARLVSDRGAPPLSPGPTTGPSFQCPARSCAGQRRRASRPRTSSPGKPWQNGTDESFNGRLREECLSMEWFSHATRGSGDHRDVAASLATRSDRAISSLGYLTPTEFREKHVATNNQIGTAAF